MLQILTVLCQWQTEMNCFSFIKCPIWVITEKCVCLSFEWFDVANCLIAFFVGLPQGAVMVLYCDFNFFDLLCCLQCSCRAIVERCCKTGCKDIKETCATFLKVGHQVSRQLSAVLNELITWNSHLWNFEWSCSWHQLNALPIIIKTTQRTLAHFPLPKSQKFLLFLCFESFSLIDITFQVSCLSNFSKAIVKKSTLLPIVLKKQKQKVFLTHHKTNQEFCQSPTPSQNYQPCSESFSSNKHPMSSDSGAALCVPKGRFHPWFHCLWVGPLWQNANSWWPVHAAWHKQHLSLMPSKSEAHFQPLCVLTLWMNWRGFTMANWQILQSKLWLIVR